MNANIEKQAQHVVESFKKQLSKSGIEHVGQQHFAQLQLLIESALTSASLQQSKQLADQLEHLAQGLRKDGQ
ncbi:hypothetical protein SAMN02745127_01551 [Oceanospirillum multiglobuliferum]|uniref:Uncharacterized protein n=1 Tax=Oceanospirillum multiglobuliferum TaxID=64969 RepID=A0A1T4PNW3_9GAMM|nr:hypothetical protein [Oceanospirillum multiglobuliferum]OPX55391.1 hypothetical protein BTE48_09500 [Oceanospirillum multiglobuliferum]SJZ93295.1 hypothetical protein SAMN02745127_01551 [Oceanospirillum multiglobuliferum]